MRLSTKLSAEQYIRSFRQQMGAFSSFGEEHFTGFFIGRFFSVTYHSGWEWNRKFTNEKNRAIGYVRDTAVGTEVRFLRFYGYSNPLSLISIFLFGFFVGLLALSGAEYHAEMNPKLLLGALFGACVMVFSALESAIAAYVTERGIYGGNILMAYLNNPADPWEQE